MDYYIRLIPELHNLQVRFAVVGALLLLEAGVLALATRRRAGAPPLARLPLAATVAWAVGAFALSGYVWWQARVLSPNIPFHRLPDGGITYDKPVVVVVATNG
jgi:hypothetical protein